MFLSFEASSLFIIHSEIKQRTRFARITLPKGEYDLFLPTSPDGHIVCEMRQELFELADVPTFL